MPGMTKGFTSLETPTPSSVQMDLDSPMRSAIALLQTMSFRSFGLSPARSSSSVRACTVLTMAVSLSGAWVEPQRAPASVIRAISIAPRGGEALVRILMNGPLPEPSVGVVDGPPRIFVDFADVRIAVKAVTPSPDPRILRVRVAYHSAQPPVTRVVIDLATPQPLRIERDPTELRIVLGTQPEAEAPPLLPVPPLPEPVPSPPRSESVVRAPASVPGPIGPEPAVPHKAPVPAPSPSAAPRPSGPTAQPAPQRDLERYRRQVTTALDRMRLQQPLLVSLDAREDQSAARIQMAVEEFERLRQDLAAVKPPETLRTQHDMLIQAATLGLMAARLRLESLGNGDANTLRNAASAAAGAILLLDRACADIGCPEPPGR
jgi:hypothetical protein